LSYFEAGVSHVVFRILGNLNEFSGILRNVEEFSGILMNFKGF
jgi:hypothetical protein